MKLYELKRKPGHCVSDQRPASRCAWYTTSMAHAKKLMQTKKVLLKNGNTAGSLTLCSLNLKTNLKAADWCNLLQSDASGLWCDLTPQDLIIDRLVLIHWEGGVT